MFQADPTLQLAAFGLNIVDDEAPAYAGWFVPPLGGCVGDATSFAILGALGGLRATAVLNTYAGELAATGLQLPPYRKVLDCTAEAVAAQLTQRAAAVTGDELSVVVISGHGTREQYLLESVESLVLSDRLMPDYELHNLLAQFPAGSRVAVFLDTCHAGGMDRALRFQLRSKAAPPLARLTERAARPLQREIRANVAFFSACVREETARDGQFNGAFTASVMRAALAAIESATRPPWWDVMNLAAHYCVTDFRQTPDYKTYGDAQVWRRPFLT